MYRKICLVLAVSLLLGGCVRKQTPPATKTDKTQAPAPAGPVKAAAPKANSVSQTPEAAATPAPSVAPAAPVEAGHPIIAVARQFLSAVGAGDSGRAMALCMGDKLTAQGLTQMNLAFQMDQADVTQAWLGSKQAVVITNFIPTKQGGVAGAWWSLSLVAAEEGRWRISAMTFLPDEPAVEKYLATFRTAEPDAKFIEL